MVILRERSKRFNESAYKVISVSDLHNSLLKMDMDNLAIFKFYVSQSLGIGNHIMYGNFRYIPYKSDYSFSFRDGKNIIEIVTMAIKEIRVFKDSLDFVMKNGAFIRLGFNPQLFKYF